MSKQKLNLISLFFFIIPYLLTIFIAAVAYDSLVIHSSTWDRTIFGGLVGATLMYFIKLPLERPLTVVHKETTSPFLKGLTQLFLAENHPYLIALNFIIDFSLICLTTYLLRSWFSLAFLSGSLLGWSIMALFTSICIGANLGFKLITIQQDTNVENN